MADDTQIRLAQGRADFDACVLLQKAVWGLSDLETTSAPALMAAAHSGAILALAESADGRAVGFAFALPALRAGRWHFRSDMLAVLADYQQRGVGVRLKWAQREEALARGADLVAWSYDPLQARNAHLNLRRLGAHAVEFLEDVFGTGASGEAGLGADRLSVRWELDAPRVRELAAGPELPPTTAAPDGARINDVRWQAGWPVSSEPVLDLEDARLLLEIPPDWEILTRAAPRVAQGWQEKVRRAFKAYFGRGYAATDFAPTEEGGRRRPLYVLERVRP